MRRKLISSCLLVVVLSFLIPLTFSTEANATSCPTSYTNPDLVFVHYSNTPIRIATLSEFVQFNNVDIPSICYPSAVAYYNSWVTKSLATTITANTNTFGTRLTACMKGQSVSVWSPSSYVNWGKCMFQVSFIPSSTQLVQSLNNVD